MAKKSAGTNVKPAGTEQEKDAMPPAQNPPFKQPTIPGGPYYKQKGANGR